MRGRYEIPADASYRLGRRHLSAGRHSGVAARAARTGGAAAAGGFLLNSGWVLDPVGKQVPLDTLPMATALSPDGKHLLVLNGGYRPPPSA